MRLEDFSTHTRARTLIAPINDAELVGAVACELLRDFGATRAGRLLGVRVAGFVAGTCETPAQLALPL